MCHFQIAPGLAVFSISEFKAVPRSRCNHLCDRRATISRQRSVTLYFFFLFSFLPSPFFSFSISATFSFLLLYISFFASFLFDRSPSYRDLSFAQRFFPVFPKSRPSYFFLSFFLFFSRTWFDSDPLSRYVYIYICHR